MENKKEYCFSESDFKAELVRKNITLAELATKMGISESTLHRKIKNNGSFSRKEISILFSIFTVEVAMKFLYGC